MDRTIQLIRHSGCKPGLVFNPATSLNWLDYVIDKIDVILLMSVNPGFGGQEFIPEVLPKLAEARARISAAGRDIRLEIDGGVKVENAASIARAGADTFVAGSAIFGSADYARTIKAMRAQIDLGRRTSRRLADAWRVAYSSSSSSSSSSCWLGRGYSWRRRRSRRLSREQSRDAS